MSDYEMRTELLSFQNAVLRYVADLGLSDYDVSQLTANKVTSDFFEKEGSSVAMPSKSLTCPQGEVACS